MTTSVLHKNEKGLSLIECLFAMVITMIGVLAVAGLFTVGIRIQAESRNATAANAWARAKIEQLENYRSTVAERNRGGSLTTNVANYNDTPEGNTGPYRRRWLIENNPTDAGVPANTQRITVVVVPNRAGVLLPPVRVTVLAPVE